MVALGGRARNYFNLLIFCASRTGRPFWLPREAWVIQA